MTRRHLGGYAGKAIVLMIALCFLMSTALAEGAPSLSPMLDEWLESIGNGEAADIALSASLHALSPYGEQTVQAMNRLLSALSVQIGYRQSEQVETAKTQLAIGNSIAVDFAERTGTPLLAQTSLLPGMTLASSSGPPLNLLLGQEMEIPFWAADILDPNGLAGSIQQALGGLAVFMQEKAGSYRISSAGTARKALVYTVPEDSVQLLRDSLILFANHLHWREAAAFVQSLSITGDAVITLYQSGEGVNMGLGIKASAGFENVVPRKVNFLWAFSARDMNDVHTLSIKAPAIKGADNFTAAGELALKTGKNKNSLYLSLDMKDKRDGKTERIQLDGQLDCLLAQDNQRLEGEIERIHTDPEGVAHCLTIKPSLLTLKVGDTYSAKGSVRVLWASDKSVQTDVTVSIKADKAQDVLWEEMADTVSLDGLGEGELAAMVEKAQAAAAEAIWQAVLSLPQDCLELIEKNISQDDWERIYRGAYQVDQ